jgi:hypothetical protein
VITQKALLLPTMVEEKAIRTLPFDGNADKWRKWKLKFLAKARAGGYKKILTGETVVPPDTGVVTDDDIKVIELNYKAYDALALACEGVAFGAIESAVTAGLSDGDAHLAWTNLLERYELTTKMSLVQLKRDFTTKRLEDASADPDLWIQDLEHLRLRIKGVAGATPISDDDMIAHILANLPEDYSELITSVEIELSRVSVTTVTTVPTTTTETITPRSTTTSTTTSSTYLLNDLVIRIRAFYQ